MAAANADAVRLVKPFVEQTVAAAIAGALADGGAVKEAIANAVSAGVSAIYLGSGDDLPTGKTAKVGQLFVKTGNTNPGLYVCTAQTSSTSTWKAVEHAS